MTIALYKFTGEIRGPEAYDSAIPAPVYYGYAANGTGYALLDSAFAALCTTDNEDLAVTTNADDKDWVRNNTAQARHIRNECQAAIRKKYKLEDELKALRTADAVVAADIASIVAPFSAELDALVGD